MRFEIALILSFIPDTSVIFALPEACVFRLARILLLQQLKREGHIHRIEAGSKQRRDTEGCAAAIASAVNLRPSSLSLMKDAFKVLLQTGHYQDILDIYENRMDKELQKNTRLRYSCMIALYHTGRYREALSIISENGGLVPDDIREGDDELERVYLNLLQKLELPQSVPSRVKFRSL